METIISEEKGSRREFRRQEQVEANRRNEEVALRKAEHKMREEEQ